MQAMKCELDHKGNIHYVLFFHFQLVNLFLWLSSEHSSIYPDHSLDSEQKHSVNINLNSYEYVWMITSTF